MTTPSLRELQELFWRGIATAPGALTAPPRLLEVSEPSATLDSSGRLRVYADAYLWRLRDVLAEDFPRVAAILGPDRFADLACAYLRFHPSTSPSVRHLGRHFARAIARHAELPPWLAGLARLEWARREVFDAADCAPLTPGALRSARPEDWPALRFDPIPALAVVRADWPVHEVWEGTDMAEVAAAPSVIRVWRAEDDRVYHAAMDRRDAEALDRLMAREPFGVICAAFDDLPPLEGAQRATSLLARWLEDGIIASLA